MRSGATSSYRSIASESRTAGVAASTHLYDLLQARAARFPDAVAFGGQQGLVWRTVSSAEALRLTDALAAELAEAGVQESDRVVLWLPNHWRTPIYLFALWKLGAVAVPFDREMNPEAAVRIIASVAPRLLIVGYPAKPSWAQTVSTAMWWEPGTRAHAPSRAWTRPAEELATISFTSGTTGHPKGCMLTHANLCFQVAAFPQRFPLDPSCRAASILPISHMLELTVGMLYPVAAGAAVHYVPSRRMPDILRVLSEQRVTHMLVVPQFLVMVGEAVEARLRERVPAPALGMVSAAADRLPLFVRRLLYWPVHRLLGGHLRLFACGGAVLPAEAQRLWEQMGVRVVQGYGTSECSPVVSCGFADGRTPVGSTGPAIPGVEVRLSTAGEVLVRGPNVMRGYWRDPARTAEAIDAVGWYHTGDLGTLDDAGNLTIVGRATDLIVLPSGMHVWPDDVEDVLRDSPDVKDAAVVGVPANGGVTLHAYLVPISPADRAADLPSIVAAGNRRLAQHQRVASASWWPDGDFPRTGLGKVRRHLLPRPTVATGSVQVDGVLAVDDPVGQAIARVARLASVDAHRTLEQLGIDSIGVVELAVALEEGTGRRIADDALRPDMTVERLRRVVAEAAPAEVESLGVGPAPGGTPALWPYTWGRVFRFLAWPVDLLYRAAVTRSTVLGAERLDAVPRGRAVIVAGTHHSFPDLALVRWGLEHSPLRGLSRRTVVVVRGEGMQAAGPYATYASLAFGLFPLRRQGGYGGDLQQLARLMSAGNALLIFPQGRHSRPEQERAGDPAVDFQPGVAVLAQSLDALVVPFGLAGTERMMPAFLETFRGMVIARTIPLAIRVGPLAIAFGDPLSPRPDEEPSAFASRLQVVCYELTRRAEAALRTLQSTGAGR